MFKGFCFVSSLFIMIFFNSVLNNFGWALCIIALMPLFLHIISVLKIFERYEVIRGEYEGDIFFMILKNYVTGTETTYYMEDIENGIWVHDYGEYLPIKTVRYYYNKYCKGI